LIKKQNFITHPTIKKNIKTNCICRETLVNEERILNMDNDERYIIRSYDSTENLTKFYKTRYCDFFSVPSIIKRIYEDDC
jgi:hypothetical protein